MGKWGSRITRLVLIALGIFGIYAGFRFIGQVMPYPGDGMGLFALIGLIIISIIIGLVLTIILHEIGHLVMGLLTGYSFVSFGVLNLLIMKENGKLVKKNARFKGALGSCQLSPPDMANEKFPYKLYFVGGVFVNFIVAAICFSLFFRLANSTQFWAGVFLVIGVVNGFLGLGNLIPSKYDANDGYYLLSLGSAKNKEERFRLWRQFRVQALQSTGCRPRDIPPAYFEWADINDTIDNPFVFAAAVLQYEYWADKGEMKQAREVLQTIYNNIGHSLSAYQIAIVPELLFHELIGECREDEISRYYTTEVDRVMKLSSSNEGIQRTLYAYARLVTKDAAEAEKRLDLFHKACSNSVGIGKIPGEQELIKLVDQIADERERNG